ncbi:MAG: hypothetical protein K2L81_02835 [Muribaculaceae bacterium]|nr:hypothetical protein [Muribaculaceae bacterium]
MKLIDLHITYLLGRHDCVIVPGWGAFVASYEPAHIDTAAGIIYPPSRTMAFNPSLNHNDGLLASSIARAEGITYDQASELIATTVKGMRDDLVAQGHLLVDQVGTFLLQGETLAPIFTPANSPLTCADCFLLRPVAAPALRETVRRDAIIRGELSPKPHRSGQWLRVAGRIAASVALLVGLGILLTTPIAVDRDIDHASLNPVATITAPKAATAPAIQPVESKADTPATEDVAMPSAEAQPVVEAINDSKAETKAAAPKAELATSATTATRRMLADAPYCLIVASLPTRGEAESFLRRDSDKSLQILEKDGKYRIYAATGRTIAQAQAHLNNGSLGRNYPGAWVCHR